MKIGNAAFNIFMDAFNEYYLIKKAYMSSMKTVFARPGGNTDV